MLGRSSLVPQKKPTISHNPMEPVIYRYPTLPPVCSCLCLFLHFLLLLRHLDKVLGVVEANSRDKRTVDWSWWYTLYRRMRQEAKVSLDFLLLEGTERRKGEEEEKQEEQMEGRGGKS